MEATELGCRPLASELTNTTDASVARRHRRTTRHAHALHAAVRHVWATYGHTGGNPTKRKRPESLEIQAFIVGTPAWTRTKDQLIKSQLLYQLSYRGILRWGGRVARRVTRGAAPTGEL